MVPEDDVDRRRKRYRRAVEILREQARDPRLVKDDTYAEKLATETAQERISSFVDDVILLTCCQSTGKTARILA